MLRFCAVAAAGLTVIAIGGCSSGMGRIDARTHALLVETAADINAHSSVPRLYPETYREGDALSFPSNDIFTPPTTNPDAEAIEFSPAPPPDVEPGEAVDESEAEEVLGRLADDPPVFPEEAGPDALVLDLRAALEIALHQAREFRTAEEEFILAALRLLIERHRWGPRFFDEVSALVVGVGEDNLYDTSLQLVNEFGVTQRLPYGGEVSARLLARATEDLHLTVAGERVQSAEIILGANLPLLRGAGLAAREPRISAERELIYDARDFERFRRQFLVEVTTDFLELVVQQQAIRNAESQLQRFLELERRAQRLADSGRQPSFDILLAAQDVLFAQDDLRSQRESYRFAVDRFKVRLGMAVDRKVVIVPSTLGLPVPAIDVDEAVRNALAYRLDLQTQRDLLDDARRGVDIAKNAMLPDLDLAGSLSIPTDDERDRAGLRFNTEDTAFSAGVTFGLPIDREIERLSLRQAQINLERAVRRYDEFRDSLVIEVRDDVREIERALFSLRLQEENIRIAQRRIQAINIDDTATARDRSEAADSLTRAEDQRDRAARDVQIAILQYLLNTGTLRVNPDGTIRPLSGMTITPDGG